MLKNIFQIRKGTLVLISVMSVITIIGLTFAWNYYGNINDSEDPRVIQAKIIYSRYNTLVEAEKYDEILLLLDSIFDIYNSYSDYKDSYENGVIYNNKAATYISMALFYHVEGLERDSLLQLAKIEAESSIKIYENWHKSFGSLSESEIIKKIQPIYLAQHQRFVKKKINKYINKRCQDIILAQRENPRRLSVSYTNLGIIQKHQNNIDGAMKSFNKALDLWDKNLSAENNINIIQGKPLKEQSILERIFPDKK